MTFVSQSFGLTGPVSPFQGITESFGAAIHGLTSTQLTDGVINRSKRMMLDTLGVGLLGTRTAVFNKALNYSQVQSTARPPIATVLTPLLLLGLSLNLSVSGSLC